jgi:hypothetical protein
VVGLDCREQFNASACAVAENSLCKPGHAEKIGLADNMRDPFCVFDSTAV